MLTSAYHPQTNGMIERNHDFIKKRMRIFAVENDLDFVKGDDWDVFLPDIECAYNNTQNEMTGCTPYEAVYGHLLRSPVDNIFNTNIDDVVESTVNTMKEKSTTGRTMKLSIKVRNYIKELKKHRGLLHKEMKENMNRYDAIRKRYYDKFRTQPHEYNVGDQVLIDVGVGKVGNKKKLNINRKAAEIILKLNDNAYMVQYADNKKEAVNLERIYLVKSSDESEVTDFIEEDEENNESP